MENVTFTFTGEAGTVEHLCEEGIKYCSAYLMECPPNEVDQVTAELKQFGTFLSKLESPDKEFLESIS